MKHKDTKHPKLYLKILNYSISDIKVQYVDNEFSLDGKRKIKEGQKTRLVQKIFSDVSENYDFMGPDNRCWFLRDL